MTTTKLKTFLALSGLALVLSYGTPVLAEEVKAEAVPPQRAAMMQALEAHRGEIMKMQQEAKELHDKIDETIASLIADNAKLKASKDVSGDLKTKLSADLDDLENIQKKLIGFREKMHEMMGRNAPMMAQPPKSEKEGEKK